MITVYIRWPNLKAEMYRVADRVDVDLDTKRFYVWWPGSSDPESVKNALVQVYIGGTLIHTYQTEKSE